jgi:hypothetical protein
VTDGPSPELQRHDPGQPPLWLFVALLVLMAAAMARGILDEPLTPDEPDEEALRERLVDENGHRVLRNKGRGRDGR